MRGNPFFQAIFMIALFSLVGVPVYRLTRPAAAAAAAPSVSAGAAETTGDTTAGKPASVQLDAVCASAPTDFQIKCLDQTVLTGHAPQAHFSRTWTAVIPAEGADLVIEARWPPSASGSSTSADASSGANPAAVRITVRLANGRAVDKSFWAGANGTLDEVLTIPGAAADPAAP